MEIKLRFYANNRKEVVLWIILKEYNNSKKQDIKNDNNLRATTFIEQILGSIFRDEVPYMLRQRLITLYKEYSIQSSGSDEWYGFSFQSEKEFKKIIKEIRLQLGKDD